MHKLIDAEKLFDEVLNIKVKSEQERRDINMFLKMIINSPLFSGEWILDETDNSVSCSDCGCMLYPNDILQGDPYYCPNCGRRMCGK